MVKSRGGTLIAAFSRRDFLGGVIVGGGAIATGMFLRPTPSFKLDVAAEEMLPKLGSYPITLWDDCYRLFMHIGATLFPRVRRVAEYQKQEVEAFKAVWEQDFFLYANDYAVRFQRHYGDTTLIIPRDRKVAEQYLAESIQAYPQAWSQIVHTMLTNSPGVLLAYLSEEKS